MYCVGTYYSLKYIYRHINIKLHDRAFCVWSSCVIKWIVCSHDAKQERHFLKYAATKAILVKFYVVLSTYHGSLQQRVPGKIRWFEVW